MSENTESGAQVTSWRIAASTVHLCDRCHTRYATARFCPNCLRAADADPDEKRIILLAPHEAADDLSAIVMARSAAHKQRPRMLGALFARGIR